MSDEMKPRATNHIKSFEETIGRESEVGVVVNEPKDNVYFLGDLVWLDGLPNGVETLKLSECREKTYAI